MYRKATPELLKKYIKPTQWYEYRDIMALGMPLSNATIIRLLQRTPHTVIKKRIEGSAVAYPRRVRIFPGGAIIDAAAVSGIRPKDSEVFEHDDRGYVSEETETGSAPEGDSSFTGSNGA